MVFPTDARLHYKSRERLVSLARRRGVALRQSYVRLGRAALVAGSRYARAGQLKRPGKATKALKRYLGCVVRDIRRKARSPGARLAAELEKAERLLSQRRESKNKLYSLHAPEVECIAKGKAHKKYEFGCKVSVVSTSLGGWIVGARSFHGNPWDGHTLAEAMSQAKRLAGRAPQHAHVDRGHGAQGPTRVHIAGSSKRKRSRWERMWLRRRNAVEAVISALKRANQLDRNHLLG